MKITTINPTTGEKIKDYELFDKKRLGYLIINSKKSQKNWKELSIDSRLRFLKDIEIYLLKNKKEFAELITEEMGKPINESIAEIEKCALVCNYYFNHAKKFLENEKIKTQHRISYVTFQPLGIILGIMPWNFPFWQVFRFAIPALCVGNTVILKHASNTTECSLAIEKIFNKFLPKDVFQSVVTNSGGVDYLMDKVQGVSLTGSVETGKIIAQKASKNLKKFVLELGGNDPFLVLNDADIKLASENAVKARFLNSGQSCIAAKRFIVVENKFNEFLDRTTLLIKSLEVGNPMDPSTEVGPLAKKEFVDNLDKQVKASLKEGAKLIYGGEKLSGNFYMPTIIVSNSKTKVANEETFGPVFVLIKAKDDEDALRIANESNFGLGANVWTKNIKKGIYFAERLECGIVYVNGVVRSDPRMPFGGIKNSGIGRELGRYGLLEFCNIKTVVVD